MTANVLATMNAPKPAASTGAANSGSNVSQVSGRSKTCATTGTSALTAPKNLGFAERETKGVSAWCVAGANGSNIRRTVMKTSAVRAVKPKPSRVVSTGKEPSISAAKTANGSPKVSVLTPTCAITKRRPPLVAVEEGGVFSTTLACKASGSRTTAPSVCYREAALTAMTMKRHAASIIVASCANTVTTGNTASGKHATIPTSVKIRMSLSGSCAEMTTRG